MAITKNALTGSLIGLSLIISASQPSLAAKDSQALASADEIRLVAAQLAACPELSTWVKQMMDERFGLLTQADVSMIQAEAQSCQEHHRKIPQNASLHLAYSALARQFDLADWSQSQDTSDAANQSMDQPQIRAANVF